MGQILRDEKFLDLVRTSSTTLSLPAGTKVNVGGQQPVIDSDLELDITVVGVGGMDIAVTSGTYYIYVTVVNGAPFLIGSLNDDDTGPTGFPAYGIVGTMGTNGTSVGSLRAVANKFLGS